MKRFDFDDEDDYQDDNLFRDIDDDDDEEKDEEIVELSVEEYAEFLGYRDEFEKRQLDLTETEQNQKLLSIAIDVLKTSFWWKFKSSNSKLRQVARTYKALKMMIELEKEEDKNA